MPGGAPPASSVASVQEWFSFGRGVHGELGRKVETNVEAPGLQNADVRPLALTPVSSDGGTPILDDVVCGQFHCIARTATGHVLVWGANSQGQLGLGGELGDDEFVSAPVRALGAIREQSRNERICAVAGGRSHSIFVTTPGGRCFVAGRLPAVEPGPREDDVLEDLREIVLCDNDGNEPNGIVISCSVGESQTFFITSEGEVWSWRGDNEARSRRVGLDGPVTRSVPGLPKVTQIACGHHHTLALTEDRRIFSWGCGCFGQLGLGACRLNPSPTQVPLPEECNGQVIDIAGGFASSFAVTAQGWVFCWGANDKCELGLGQGFRGTATPKLLENMMRVRVVQIAAGSSHTACVTSEGLLYLWGFGAYGQLGYSFNDAKGSASLVNAICVGVLGDTTSNGNSINAGSSSSGHKGSWMQMWPRRCVRGPFGTYRCTAVQCGAHHTLARASSVRLAMPAGIAHEVLDPEPSENSCLRALAASGEAIEKSLLSQGLISRADSNSRQALRKRNMESFRTLAGAMWNTSPHKGRTPAIKLQPKPHKSADYGTWQRLLDNSDTKACSPSNIRHPLENCTGNVEHALGSSLVAASISAENACFTWDAVDEAVHQAFSTGAVADPRQELDLAERVAALGASPLSGHADFFSDKVLPPGPSPFRGLARLECLTPRPFYAQDLLKPMKVDEGDEAIDTSVPTTSGIEAAIEVSSREFADEQESGRPLALLTPGLSEEERLCQVTTASEDVPFVQDYGYGDY